VKPRPPCPGDASGPPGHHKVLPAPTRPCSGGVGKANGHATNGIVFVLPLGLAGLVAGTTRRLTNRRRRP
jgi:hypothetical protein